MRQIWLMYLIISISFVCLHSITSKTIAITIDIKYMSDDISIWQIALIETGTERNSRNVVKSAARPIDWYFIFLRAISTTKRKARNGAKMKFAPIVYRISIAYTSVAFN